MGRKLNGGTRVSVWREKSIVEQALLLKARPRAPPVIMRFAAVVGLSHHRAHGLTWCELLSIKQTGWANHDLIGETMRRRSVSDLAKHHVLKRPVGIRGQEIFNVGDNA